MQARVHVSQQKIIMADNWRTHSAVPFDDFSNVQLGANAEESDHNDIDVGGPNVDHVPLSPNAHRSNTVPSEINTAATSNTINTTASNHNITQSDDESLPQTWIDVSGIF